MSHLWDIIQAHLDEYGVREAALARRMDTSPQTLNSWKKRGLKQLPERWLLEAVARETKTPYEDVLDAVLFDISYKDDVALAARKGKPDRLPDTFDAEGVDEPGPELGA